MNLSKYVDKIENVRHSNNALWMMILRIALASRPEETKHCLRRIRANDLKISTLIGKLANGHRRPENKSK